MQNVIISNLFRHPYSENKLSGTLAVPVFMREKRCLKLYPLLKPPPLSKSGLMKPVQTVYPDLAAQHLLMKRNDRTAMRMPILPLYLLNLLGTWPKPLQQSGFLQEGHVVHCLWRHPSRDSALPIRATPADESDILHCKSTPASSPTLHPTTHICVYIPGESEGKRSFHGI